MLCRQCEQVEVGRKWYCEECSIKRNKARQYAFYKVGSRTKNKLDYDFHFNAYMLDMHKPVIDDKWLRR